MRGCLILLFVGASSLVGAEPTVPMYEKDVLPLLKSHCFRCHGVEKPKADFDMRTRAGLNKGGKNGPVLTPGSLKDSQLWLNVATDAMPPDKERLSDAEKDIIRRWVLAGTPGEGVAALKTAFGPKTRDVAKAVKKGIPTVAKLVDDLIDRDLKENKIPASPQANDAEFLRRVSLDLTGRVPSADKVRAFLASTEPDKRTKLIDELLASSEHGKHLGTIFAGLLAAEEPGRKPALETWLAEGFNKNRGWHEMVRELLQAETGGEVGFITSNIENNQPDAGKLAGATARFFLGVQLQCAECHNHPFNDWKQTDFWGLAAFFGKTKMKKGTPGGVEELPVAAKGKTPAGPNITLPVTAGRGAGKVVKAKFPLGDEAKLEVEKPYRPALAEWVTAADNPFFAKAAVNRFWSLLLGKGLANPVDDLDETNPPTHPEVLQVLAEEFRAANHDIKHLIRCIVQTRAYQRSSRPLPGNEKDETLYSRQAVKVMSPEMLHDALVQALGVKQLKVTIPVTGTTSGRKTKVKADARTTFIEFFTTRTGDTASTEYTHGILQALSLLNDPQFNQQAPILDSLMKGNDAPDKVIEGLFLNTLSRLPTTDEVKRLSEYVQRRTDRRQAYAGVLWILLNTPEFVLVR